MSEEKKKVMAVLENVIKDMTSLELASLVSYGEGLAAREDRKAAAEPAAVQAG